MIKNLVKKRLSILSNPEREFKRLSNTSFESTLSDYFSNLILLGLLAGVANLMFGIVKVLYLDIFVNTDVQYLRVVNYSLGTSTSIVLSYLFVGTFVVFILSILTRPFLPKIKYTSQLQIMICSLTPFLLFGWILYFVPGLIVWSLLLFTIGIKSYKHNYKTKKGSIHQRE